MPSPSFKRTKPYMQMENPDFRPRDEVRAEIAKMLGCMTGARYKFKLILCREEVRNHPRQQEEK